LRKCLIYGFSTALLLYCSTALLLHRYGVCIVFVAATFTVANFFTIRRLKTCDYILHAFTLHAKKSPLPLFKKEGFFGRKINKQISLYPSLRKRDFKSRKCLIYGFSTALLLHCSTALL